MLVVCVCLARADWFSLKAHGQTPSFVTTKVLPLLKARCYKCHGPQLDEPKGNLRLDTRARILTGGDSGAAIVPGEPSKSLLVDSINWTGDYEMPPKSKMPAAEIAILTRWVEMGAPWPNSSDGEPVVKAVFPLHQRRASHWAWQAVKHFEPPAVKDSSWPRQPLDHFILQKLEAKGLTPASPADRRTLIRRASFALIGLPPTPEEVSVFVDDPAATDEAFEMAVDRLLKSSHFGERWARHWLDLMRYAESRGHEFDHTAPNAYHYRDYVIRALNGDLPYDQFVVEQLAGDLLPQPRLHPAQGSNESVLGTGFWYMGEWVHSPTDIRQDEADRIDGAIDTIGRAFLGMTIACARCHDHKFDAISTKDYYAFAGFVQSSRYRQVRFDTMEHNRQVAQQLWTLRRKYEAEMSHTIGESLKPVVGRLAAYLLAARDTILNAENVDDPSNLDTGVLRKLVEHFGQAKENVNDPLHLWALACQAESNVDELVASCAERLQAERAKQERSDVRILVDYAKTSEHDWAQDGFAFGDGPVRPGTLRLGNDAANPVAGVYTYGAARRDPLWSGLALAAGTEKDPGALGKVSRSGQTLCTPTFTIQSGTIHYLVKGAAKVQAVVDSHRLIAGPLHGALIQSFKTGDEHRWISHRLDRYVGHRAHLEFVPDDDGELEVLMVVDGKTSGVGFQLAENALTNAQIASGKLTLRTPESLAAALETVFAATCNKLSAGAAKSPMDLDEARLADWMLQHRKLFVAPENLADEQRTTIAKTYFERRAKLASQIKKTSRTAMAIWDGTAEDERLLIRGHSNNPGELVPRRFLEAISGAKPTKYATRSGRLELARQMVDAKTNPLIARVMVNRVWQHLFGQAIVPTPDNFGVLGRPPSHPELLDHLAERFVAGGWSIKTLIREIVTSQTWQMSSKPLDTRAEQEDPDNVLLHRMHVRRLEGEAVRDAILAVSGRLDPTLEGPPIPVYLTSFMTGRGRPRGGPLDGAGRRSIYTSVRRNFLSPMMLAFDVPIPTQPAGRRNVSNVPAQALILMNDPFVKQQAETWAQRMLTEQGMTPEQRVRRMYELAFARPPTADELSDALAFLQHAAVDDQWQRDPARWTDLGHVLWNVKEFIFID